ncbi:MAG TPA: CAP domain-containing protein [Candidatus Absconditabacterales bacterium]|nr:CAP domain-containing protein [Candidatus Absconditabacterales bacterium]
MGKAKNIATGLIMTGAILGINGQDIFSQNIENSNNKENMVNIQNDTSKKLIGLDQYDYQKMLNIEISLLSPDAIKKVMLEGINEIRKEHNLPTLKYNITLDSIAGGFSKEKINTNRREDKFCHFDNKKKGPYERILESNLRNKLILTKENLETKGVEENLSTANSNIKKILESLMNSKNHKDAILSKHINSIGIAYNKEANIVVQLFANIKK